MVDPDALYRIWVRTLEDLGVDPQDEYDVEEIVVPAFSERTNLHVLGVGTMRAVFDLGSGNVIKLPIHQGLEANMSECARWRAYGDRREGRLLAPVVDCAVDGRWLIQQKVAHDAT